MSLALLSESRSFGGLQSVHRHDSAALGCPMRFGLYLPPQAAQGPVPVLYWLSGLTCTEENFIVKAGAQRVAAALGLAIVACDTSPRGLGYPGESDHWDFGVGAGYYVDAAEPPWRDGYRMETYVTRELRELVEAEFPLDGERRGIFGHSMGGHGALTLALRHPEQYRTVSAFAPIASPMRCPWGQKAFTRFFGTELSRWAEHDATQLVRARGWPGPVVLVDQGTRDPFLETQLRPDLLREAFEGAGAALQLRLQEGYDHSYYFIATFIADHLRHHARHLGLAGGAAEPVEENALSH